MIRSSRRRLLAGALAVPTLSGLAAWRWRHGEARVLLHDPSLVAGQRFAEAGRARGLRPVALEGDRVRLLREVLGARPALVAGVSRHADALLVADIAAEAGYVLAAELEGRGRNCSSGTCRPGWNALARLGRAAGSNWPEVLAHWAADPRGRAPQLAGITAARFDSGLVLGWVLAPRG